MEIIRLKKHGEVNATKEAEKGILLAALISKV
jgi:hypothetical protein